MAFSPDGHTIATTSGDSGTVQLWDITNRNAPTPTATIPDKHVSVVAFSSDGRTLAAANHPDNEGGTVQLWDVTDRKAPTRTATIPDQRNVSALAFTPDRHSLADATPPSDDGTVQLWDVEWVTSLSGQIRSRACAAAGGGLTADEWSRLIPDVSYHQTC